jgi:hypothetical protein
VWVVDLSTYDFEKFKIEVVVNLGKDQTHFRKLLDSLITRGKFKWQGIISNSRIYGPKKFAFLKSNQDFFEFVEAVYEALNSKVTIKLVMDNPLQKEKQLEHLNTFLSNRIICGTDIGDVPRSVAWRKT